MDQEELRRVWQEQSQKAFGQVNDRQEQHPDATLAEIEETVHHHLMRLRAQLIQDVTQVSAEPLPSQIQHCPHCQTHMQARGRKKQALQTLGGQHVEL